MKEELPYRISELILAKLSETLTMEEEVEFRTWRSASLENEALFQRISNEARFDAYRKRYKEHTYHARFELFNRRIRRHTRRRLLSRIGYSAAVLLPFLVAALLFLPDFSPGIVPEQIHAGTFKAELRLPDGSIIPLGALKQTPEQIATHAVLRQDTLHYLPRDSSELSPKFHELYIPRGGEYFVCLSDGTNVWLNAESRLHYPVRFASHERRVYIEGEAYFEVAGNSRSPFIVESRNQAVKVLGTSFSVRAYQGEPEIYTTLEKGRVSVQTAFGEVVLSPGEQAVVKGDKLEVREVNTAIYTAWRKGKFVFIDQSLETILSTLSRWYDVEILYEYPALQQIRFTGELTRYADIEVLLEKIEIIEKVRFTVKERAVTVTAY